MSRANHWLVKHHGIFQGYYFWHHIGLDRDARERYRDSEYFEYAEEFCAKYDQVAFDADYKSEPLEHFEPLVRTRLVKSVAGAIGAGSGGSVTPPCGLSGAASA